MALFKINRPLVPIKAHYFFFMAGKCQTHFSLSFIKRYSVIYSYCLIFANN